MKKLLLPLIAIFGLAACKSTQKATTTESKQYELANALLWKVSGNGLTAPNYLYGTYHIMCKEDVNFTPETYQAIEDAKALYLELDLDDPATMMGMMKSMNMKGDKKLKDLYKNPADYQIIRKYYKDSVGIDIDNVNLSPMMLQMTLYQKMVPCKQVSGVEPELMAIAAKNKKPIYGFETVEYQLSIFDSIPMERQAEMLLDAIKDMGKSQAEFDKMYALYKARKLNTLQPMFEDENNEYKEFMPMMLDNRNRNWITVMKKEMPSGPYFMAVGAGHLVGPTGLISLLRKEGYTVEPVN